MGLPSKTPLLDGVSEPPGAARSTAGAGSKVSLTTTVPGPGENWPTPSLPDEAVVIWAPVSAWSS